MSSLFGSDPPADTFADSLERIYGVMNTLWPRILRAGADVILDFAFWQRSQRDAARSLAAQAWSETQLYHVRCSEQTARRRCLLRNADLQGSLFISEQTFELLRQRLEPLGPDEPHITIDTDGDPDRDADGDPDR
jgi:predicted kinase